MRIVRPFSKNGLARYYTHSYFKILEKEPHVNKFYESMDLIVNPEAVFTQLSQFLVKKLNYSVENMYYDTTTIHFFSKIDDLRKKGYGKTGPRGAPLVKLALTCTEDYLPLSYSVHPGNVPDIDCFKEYITINTDKLTKGKNVLFFDAGCYSFDIITDLDQKGLLYVASADITSYSLQGTLLTFIINEQEWQVQEALFKNHRVITGYNKNHHLKARQKIDNNINRVKEYITKVEGRNQKSKLNKIETLISSLKLKKVLTVLDKEDSFEIEVQEEKLEKKKEQAKLVVLLTNREGDTEFILSEYLRRGEVERAYHYIKSPLEAQPVNHEKGSRIRSHFFLVMMGYLHLTALRLYLKQQYQIHFTLDQLIEDLRFTVCLALEPKNDIIMTFAGKQVSWINTLIKDWNLPFIKKEDDILNLEKVN
jgi:transposase